MNFTRSCTLVYFGWLLLLAAPAWSQFPQSVLCQFEKIATAELDKDGRVIAGSEESKGEIVISNLNSEHPIGTGNIGAGNLEVLRKTKDAICMVEATQDEVVGYITLFFKSGTVMYTKHETLRTLFEGERPFGFVEIGKFRVLK